MSIFLQNKNSVNKFYRDWISSRLFGIDSEFWSLTLTFKSAVIGENNLLTFLTNDEADRTVRLFSSRLNKSIFKNHYRRFAKRLIFVDFREGGKLESLDELERVLSSISTDPLKRRHRHILLEKPKSWSNDEFRALIRSTWLKSEWGHREIYAEPVRSLDGSVRYNLKTGGESFVPQNSNF